MKRRTVLALGTLACAALAACEDVPLLPKWDSNWILPLPSRTIRIDSAFGDLPPGFSIPAGTSRAVNFPPQAQATDESFGRFSIDSTLRAGTRIVLTLEKPATTNVALEDTLFVGASVAALSGGNPGTITFRLAMAANQATVTSEDSLTQAKLDMIRTAFARNTPLYVQLRGRATVGPGGHRFTSSDVLTTRAKLLARIAISR